MVRILADIAECLTEGEHVRVRTLVQQAVTAGVPAPQVLQGALLPGMALVGDRFRRREVFLPDVLLAARAMNAAMEVLNPLLEGAAARGRGKVVLGTVRGDIHDLGKNLVGVMLRGAGWEVTDLGKDVAADRFVAAVADTGSSVVGLSALLTTTMENMREVVDHIHAAFSGRVRVIVGGAPVTAEFAREIGADGWAPDATTAVEAVAALASAQ